MVFERFIGKFCFVEHNMSKNNKFTLVHRRLALEMQWRSLRVR